MIVNTTYIYGWEMSHFMFPGAPVSELDFDVLKNIN